MPRIPAICQNCSTMFPSGVNIIGGRNNVFEGCTAGPCPKCGGTTVILDGVYSAVGGALHALVGRQNIDLLKRLRDTLQEAKQENLGLTEVKERIRETSPELSSVADCLPKTRGELYTVILILIALLNLLIMSGKDNFSEQEVNNYYDTTINNVYDLTVKDTVAGFKTPPLDSPPTIRDVAVKKPGRNDPCPCGSHKKFKKCCGKNRS